MRMSLLALAFAAAWVLTFTDAQRKLLLHPIRFLGKHTLTLTHTQTQQQITSFRLTTGVPVRLVKLRRPANKMHKCKLVTGRTYRSCFLSSSIMRHESWLPSGIVFGGRGGVACTRDSGLGSPEEH